MIWLQPQTTIETIHEAGRTSSKIDLPSSLDTCRAMREVDFPTQTFQVSMTSA